MRTDEFDYDLPPELIAQTPLPRGESRLLVLHRFTGEIEHRLFGDLPDYLAPRDVLVLNDTRVSARRLRAIRGNGAEAEVLLVRPFGERAWQAIVRPGRAFRPGAAVTLAGPEGGPVRADVTAVTEDGGRILEFPTAELRDRAATWGQAPLPPYIHVPLPPEQEERYQTVYARQAGSAAAPTAGLHFTPELLEKLEAAGTIIARVTLHVAVATFRPVRAETVEAHEMHAETIEVPQEAADVVNGCRGRIVAVGTTSVRTLETAAAAAASSGPTAGRVAPTTGETRLFIVPGYKFRAVDAIITNFHLPRSSLLMLVSAFAGVESTRTAYRSAIENRYRFFSFGDAMLIV
ncbi:MAG TPA: tRNA preQ1(34) S-adenosylmethionine ribosyltransferase-isomerase QueA [Chthonomonadaceae bacterium]|nr:tRNA preQ1(34) S-adenosylmethionine ribosyltransferase-isomerase QueA [Chthonomonadaceae bacterium]